MVSEQPKLVDPGVADVSEDDEYDAELVTDQEEKEKPSYVTRAVAARRAAGLDGESIPGIAQGVEARRDDVIEIDDNESVDLELPEPPMTIKVEHPDIPDTEEVATEELGRGKRVRTQRIPFSPTVKGQYHKAVGFVEATENSGGDATNCEDAIRTRCKEEFNSLHADVHSESSTDTVRNCNIETDLGHLQSEDQGVVQLKQFEGRTDADSGIRAAQGVTHPPKDGLKVEYQQDTWSGMYEGNGYHASRGFIHVQVNPAALPQRAMTKEECEAHVVGLVLVNMYC